MDDPVLDEEFRRLKKRDLFQTYFFKMSCRTFGQPKCRDRIIVAPPMSKCRDAVKTCSQDRLFCTLPTTTLLENKSAAEQRCKCYPGGNSVEHADWINERRAFREGLDSLGDLDKWFYNKPHLTEMEMLVMGRGKRTQKMLPQVPQPLNRQPSLQIQMLRESQREVKTHTRTRELSNQLENQQTREEKDEIQRQCRKDGMILTNSETAQKCSKTQDAHCYPSSLGGCTGDIMDSFRRQCLEEYLDSLEQCQRQGLALRQDTLQRALLYPGDVSVPKLVLRQAGSGALPGRVSHCRPPRKGNKDIEQGASALCKGHKHISKRQPLTRRTDTCSFWPGHDGHVCVYHPVMSRRPEDVLFHRVEHFPSPSPGHWPVNQAGYSTSGDINGRRVYTL